jgi:hypothetical protein
MQLGFVSAILPELPLEELLAFAAAEGFAVVELMCWPVGRADRRFAGVTHVDVARLTPAVDCAATPAWASADWATTPTCSIPIRRSRASPSPTSGG